MPYYQLIHAVEGDDGLIEYVVGISGDGNSVGPDVFVSVNAPNSDLARQSLFTALHEVDSWEIRGIRLDVSDERIRSLAITIPKSEFRLIERSATEPLQLFTFGCTAGLGGKGPTMEAIVLSHSFPQALELLRSELSAYYDNCNKWAVVPIRLEAERIGIFAVCLGINELRELPTGE